MSVTEIFEEFPILETENYLLTTWALADIDEVYKNYSDEDVTKYLDFKADSKRWANSCIRNMGRMYRKKEMIRWAIRRKSDNRFLGSCGFHNIKEEHYKAEVGYDLGKEHWNKGIMSEVLKTLIPFGFERMGLNRIEAWTSVENHSSIRVLLKNGFKEEGVLKDYIYIKHRNKFETVKFFGMVNSEFALKDC